MTRFAFIGPPYAGHLNPMLVLAQGLVSRGHAVTVMAQTGIGTTVAEAGIAFSPVGRSTHPVGTLDRMQARLGRTTGLIGIGGVIDDVARTTEMLCREGAEALLRMGAEAVVADQTEAAGGLLARHLGLPQISVANALLINRDALVPPPFIGWPYLDTAWGIKRNQGGYRVADLLMRPVNAVIRRFAAGWGLGPLGSIEDCLSETLQISQTVPAFDFPRREAPAALVHVGPLRTEETRGFAPPDGRPLIFCSLGTLQGGRWRIFEVVARACASLDLSLVIAHGGRLTAEQIAHLPGRPMVEAYVPQRAVMAHAAGVVTHGGLNTVLDALAAGVPLIVLPLAFEQGAIGARVERCGAGLVLSPGRLTNGRLMDALTRLRAEPSFRRNAGALRGDIAEAGGVDRAVGLIESMLSVDQPRRGGVATSQPL